MKSDLEMITEQIMNTPIIICKCGHLKQKHHDGLLHCQGTNKDESLCQCKEFVQK